MWPYLVLAGAALFAFSGRKEAPAEDPDTKVKAAVQDATAGLTDRLDELERRALAAGKAARRRKVPSSRGKKSKGRLPPASTPATGEGAPTPANDPNPSSQE